MFGSAILDVVTGIVFIYVILSMMCSAIREGIEAWLRTRAAYLERGIRELMGDVQQGNLTKQLYKHPLIYPLFFGEYPAQKLATDPRWYSSGRNLPSYIPSRNFALALLDLAAKGPANVTQANAGPTLADEVGLTLASIRSNIATLPSATLQGVVAMAVNTAGNDLEQAIKSIEAWYDSAMDRVSGMYKRATQLVLFLLGLGLAVGFNINTLALADYLYVNPSQRQALVANAEGMAKSATGEAPDAGKLKDEFADMSLPVGWGRVNTEAATAKTSGIAKFWSDYLAVALGWLLTAFAVTLGAPFWFDVLNKIVMFRTSLKPPASSQADAAPTLATPGNAAPQINVPQPSTVPPAAAAATSVQLDGCGGTPVVQTLDENLPSAHGGVAR